ncbi:MAG: hypothetical protein DRI89_13115 [Bacteroidetes bacterium]|nr:MAG: hypothetical protein DRI89_13115 [Bacteroidota bacterium]
MNTVFVEYSFNSSILFSLYYSDGSRVAEGKMNRGKSSIDMASVVNGLYLLVLRDEQGNIVQQYKLIKN